MGRTRKPQDEWMPERVYRGKSAYEYRPKDGTCIRLCPLSSKPGTLWQRYEEEKAKLSDDRHFKDIAEKYFLSQKFSALAKRTQKDYKRHAAKILPVFGDVAPHKITRKHITRYHHRRSMDSPKQANLEKAFMSAVFSWGMQDILYDLPFNPCHGVKPNKMPSREKYIEDGEYRLVYDCAPLVIRSIMEVSYLCAARLSDVVSLKKDQLLEDGIYICQGKTGKKQIKGWTPRLRKAIDDVLNEQTKTTSPHVFNHSKDTCYTPDGFGSVWRKMIKDIRLQLAKEHGKDASAFLQFTFHDLKAKGISDFEGNKKEFSGHKSDSQVAVYDRKIKVVKTVDKELPSGLEFSE